MSIAFRGVFLTAAAIAAMASNGVARAGTDEAVRWMTLRIVDRGYGDKPIPRDEAQRRLLSTFTESDTDGNGRVTETDHDLRRRMAIAQQRAQLIGQILRDDLNGDWRVTREEYLTAHAQDMRRPMSSGAGGTVEPTAEQVAELARQTLSRGMAADANLDGVITQAEMTSFAEEKAKTAGVHRGERIMPAFLDADGDGVLTRSEFVVPFERAFKDIDENGDDTLSPEELGAARGRAQVWRQEEQAAMRERQEAQREKEAATRCALPTPPGNVKMAAVSVYGGQALSTVSIGGDDAEVNVARVTVEPGREPLTLVLTSHESMIWKVDGAVDRLTNVIAGSASGDASRAPRVGIMGVAREKVVIAKHTECLPRAEGSKPDLERFARTMRTQFGRAPDYLVAHSNVATATVPSARST